MHRQAEEAQEDVYYYKGIYFKTISNEFEVINYSQGAINYNLPSQLEVVIIDDQAYYEYLGVLYQKALVDGSKSLKW